MPVRCPALWHVLAAQSTTRLAPRHIADGTRGCLCTLLAWAQCLTKSNLPGPHAPEFPPIHNKYKYPIPHAPSIPRGSPLSSSDLTLDS
eukprot:309410-Chlamydomonas_euryale.AAC.9